ncbi:HEPN domain-containing protein [Candidatus Micrarchaeota archaeon]|nr:HEPN domain-containing protein [Candidatus Micrarchaeota archaeon]MBI5177176.1 HEPN domain-containing protein [Candidatus Micrarchaeota archaeon]
MKEVQVRKIDGHKYAAYLHKAISFFQSMEAAEAEENWNGASLAAVHCAISSCDAVTTYFLGERSAGQRHEDAASLLKKINNPEMQEKARQFLSIIDRKTLIEYEPDEPSESEARQIIKQAQRFHNWAKQILPKQP